MLRPSGADSFASPVAGSGITPCSAIPASAPLCSEMGGAAPSATFVDDPFAEPMP